MTREFFHFLNDPYYWLLPVSLFLAALLGLISKKAKNTTLKNLLNKLIKLIDFWFDGDPLLLMAAVLVLILLIFFG